MDDPKNILILLPNWVGDAVMFTPTLRAIRARFPKAGMTLLGRAAPAAALTPNPWTDRIIVDGGGLVSTALRLRRERFDLAVLSPNSFRSALVARLAGARRRVGYDRDGRGFLLTDKLSPPRSADGKFAVTPAIDYYLELARVFGCKTDDKTMQLSVGQEDETRAGELLEKAGYDPKLPLVLLNPGASYGGSKLYPASRFAAVADELVERRGAQIVINAGPSEKPIAHAVQQAMNQPVLLNLAGVDNSLGLVKALVRRSSLMITNDTGPRHFAAAFGVPVVTVFGATDPDWTTLYYAREKIVRVKVDCGPCQQKTCPLPPGANHHQCMLKIPPEMVLAAAEELLQSRGEKP